METSSNFDAFDEIDTQVAVNVPEPQVQKDDPSDRSLSGANPVDDEVKEDVAIDKEPVKEPSDEKTKEQVKAEIKLKTLKLKNGEADLELREDAMVPVKINGELVNVPIKELIANHSGKTDWTRKYQDLHNERTSFYTERDSINNRINEFYRLSVEEKNPRLAIDFLAEAMGADPQEVWQNLINPVKESYKKAQELSPAELAVKERDEELDYYKRREQARKSETEKARETQGLTSRIEGTQQKYGMTPEQFKASYVELVKEAKLSGVDENELTPEMVGEYHQMVDRQSKISSFVTETWKDAPQSAKIEKQLYETWKQNPEFSIEDLKDIATQAFGKPQSKAAKVVERIKQQTPTKPKQVVSDEYITWDDL